MTIKLLILDVDGVMTDGSKTYNRLGEVVSKRFQDKDFTAIKLLQSMGVHVCFLSSDKFNTAIAQRRKIDFFLSRMPDGSINKVQFIQTFVDQYNCTPEEMAYVGDDVFDLDIMKAVKYKFCPQDAVSQLRCHADWVIDRNGGENVVYRLYEYLTDNLLVETTIDTI